MSKIEWTDRTWNPIVGCSHESAGCDNCYAEKAAASARLQQFGQYQEVIADKKWNNKLFFVPSMFEKPLHWKTPQHIFVCSMSDLFHPSIPFEWIAQVFYTMGVCYWHTFQVLTKREKRMFEFFRWIQEKKRGLWWEELGVLAAHLPTNEHEEIAEPYLTYHANAKKHYYPDIPEPVTKLGDAGIIIPWPLPNVWLGTTAENQEMWDKRKGDFFATPAAIHFVSNEPCLSEIRYTSDELRQLDWVICGGESGPGARPMHPDWARSLRDQCKEAKVPFFFKQWGAWAQAKTRGLSHLNKTRNYCIINRQGKIRQEGLCADIEPVPMHRVGKKKVGCLLDGVEHKEFPESEGKCLR